MLQPMKVGLEVLAIWFFGGAMVTVSIGGIIADYIENSDRGSWVETTGTINQFELNHECWEKTRSDDETGFGDTGLDDLTYCDPFLSITYSFYPIFENNTVENTETYSLGNSLDLIENLSSSQWSSIVSECTGKEAYLDFEECERKVNNTFLPLENVTVFYDPDNHSRSDLFSFVSNPDGFLFLILGVALVSYGFKLHYENTKSSRTHEDSEGSV